MTTPDQMPNQPDDGEHLTPSGHPSADGRGVPTELQNPFSATPPKSPWFRRPAALVSVLAVAVLVIVGLAAALVAVTGGEGSSGTAARATTTTAPSVVDSDHSAVTDRAFLGTVDPVLRLYASDDQIFGAAAAVCTVPMLATQETGKLAVIAVAQEIAKWKGLDGPAEEDSTFSMPQSLADDAADFALAAEAAYCPEEVSDGSSGL